MSDFRIRKADSSDDEAIRGINMRAWSGGTTRAELIERRHGRRTEQPWKKGMADTIGETVADPNVRTFVAEAEGRIVGYATGYVGGSEKIGTVSHNAVDPECRNRGIGAALVREVLAALKEEGAEIVQVATLDANGPAKAMYERCGFTEFTRIVCYTLECSP